ncbi:MAG: catalase, partial [Mycobacteriales bacterium]
MRDTADGEDFAGSERGHSVRMPDTDADGVPAAEAGGVSRRRFIQVASGATAGAVVLGPALRGQAAAAGEPELAAAAPDAGTAAIAATEPAAGLPPVASGDRLTTNQGVRISDDRNTLRAGARGPSLLEDFHAREKITHFDHERIPERVVHARGAGAHGVFKLTRSLRGYTTASVLTDTNATTEVFVRFSTVNGFRGSADTARDARGFATKFYTSEGVWDLVGNNIPVFFIQDAIKFPDLVHAFKPEPDREIPQASTAHDTFWDFISLTPESMHMIMWIMSDRAIPRSFRMMEGFGVHTFRLVNTRGQSTFVKFHWKPVLGVHSLVWNEAQKLGGVDPDYHRRDLARAIDERQFPQYDLGVQLLAENQVGKVKFDILDATKIWPEEVVPVQRIGRLTLDRNPDNFFAETEQVAFHTGHVVPGIDFTDDPLLQGRLFSYLDTQLNRFSGPNFHQLPINASRAPVNNYQQDSFMRLANRPGRVNYEPNSLGEPAKESPAADGGFVSYPEQVRGTKVRQRSATFGDHFSQATLFFQSMSEPEKKHLIQALQFELGKVTVRAVQERMLTRLANVDRRLVAEVAAALGLPAPGGRVNTGIGRSAALSQANQPRSAATRRVAILAADGVDAGDVSAVQAQVTAAGAHSDVIAPHLGSITAGGGGKVAVKATFLTAASVQYDAVYLPGGRVSAAALRQNGDAVHFVEEAYKHLKAIAAAGDGRSLLTTAVGDVADQPGIVTGASGAAVAAA